MGEVKRPLSISMALTVVAATIGCLWYFSRPTAVVTPTMTQVEAEAESGGYRLIDVQKLSVLHETRLDDVLLIDTRQQWEHRRGHIAGSLHFPMEPTWWAMWRNKKSLQALLGPDRNKTIVFY